MTAGTKQAMTAERMATPHFVTSGDLIADRRYAKKEKPRASRG
jgi:hypothetical protein